MATPAESESYSAPKRSPSATGLRRWGRDALLALALPSITLVLFLALWDGAVVYFNIPSTLLARPGAVVSELYYGVTSGLLARHTMITMQEVVYGFAVGAFAGFVLGAAVAESTWTRLALYPFLIAFQMIPKVAIAPLFIIWLGYGVSSKVAFTASITFFPVVINTIVGLRSVDAEVLEMMRVFRASRWQTFWRVKMKFALPYLFASLEVAMVLSVIGAIVAEFVGATGGLGYLILQQMHTLETARVFAVLVVLSLLGIVLSWLIRVAARRALFWHESERGTSS
ncbi:MAG: NitT/TauT family transport system permease protein [Betaproteobacteria bacterium]|jgi:NitT/TauT family transport system permease protein|nr:NitT/TauT family transport system permease protein [Betaproteobacteria bacterium]